MKIKIDKSIPIPTDRLRGKNRELAEALKGLKPGESILLRMDSVKVRNLAVTHLGKGNYVTRAEEGGGIRIWKR